MPFDVLGFDEIVLISYGSATFFLLLYYFVFFGRVAFYRRKPVVAPTRPVSVVVCAKNEAYNLKTNLPFVLKQEHPDYEVIVVNDASDDETVEVLLGLTSTYKNLRIVDLRENVNFFHSKKFPLSVGIKEAANEWVVFTDADCYPKTMEWLSGFQEYMTGKTDIILGYGAYERRRGLLNRLVRYETFTTGMMSLGFAMSGLPYMGVGRNLAYKRSFFFKKNGLMSHYNLASGDDDIFVNRNGRRKNTRVRPEPDFQTISRPPVSFREWVIQKRRHFSASSRYRKLTLLIPGIYHLSQIVFYAAFVLLVVRM
ncbi:MAG: glycosyltransferase, partial [Bacteroidetes bacterium]|nr:glycosyltransferase [Bacteroidota bacterium]